MIEYKRRESMLEKGERIYRLTADAIEMERPDGYKWSLKLAEIAWIRVAYAPTRFKTNRYLVTVSTRSNQKLQYDNIHFVGVANFEDRSTAFSEFTRFLIERVRESSPGAVLKSGAPAVSYFGQLFFVGAAFLLLAFVIFALPIGVGNFALTAILKLGIIIVFLPFLFKWIVKSRPQTLPMDTIPDGYLPKPGIHARED